MGTIFIYKDKLFQTLDLHKKLRRMKIKKNDIEIVLDKDEITKQDLESAFNRLNNPVKFIDESTDTKMYYWRSTDGKMLLASVNKDLDQQWLDSTGNGMKENWIKLEG